GVLSGSAFGWLFAFVFFYLVVYLFTIPPATSDSLPVAWTGNIDLLTYVRYAKYFLRLGPPNLPNFSYFDYAYLHTGAVFYFLGGLSPFFGREPIAAAMPAAFALVALAGWLCARISRAVFVLPVSASVAIGLMFVSGPFIRYIAGAYFLSTLMAMPV